jgi:hypothetical protein
MMDASTSDTIAGLPVPSKEKAARWIAHAGVAAIGVVAVLTFMPYINKALNLLLNGAMSVLELGAIAAATCFGAFALINLWPAYKRLIESFANKATWAVFEWDPVTPMQLWLKEVNADKEELESQYSQVGAVISQNEQVISDDEYKAKKADKRFAMAVQQYGADSSQAKLESIEPGTLRETASRIRENTKPLYVVRDTLKEVVDATAYMQRKAELDVSALQQEWAAAQAVDSATNAATRVLRSRSERKQNAMSSMKIIHDKYAGSLGRLQSLRQLSNDVITSVDMDKGTYHQEALERLRSESRMITGGSSQPAALTAAAGAAVSVPPAAVDTSFYSIPQASKPKGNSHTSL